MRMSPEKQVEKIASENSSESARNEETRSETVTSSSSETSPNASSSGLQQATTGKRRRTGIKTPYSFYCDQVPSYFFLGKLILLFVNHSLTPELHLFL